MKKQNGARFKVSRSRKKKFGETKPKSKESFFNAKLKEITKTDVKSQKDIDLDKYQEERRLKLKAYLKKLREDETKITFSGPARPDPNRGMRFINKFEPVNKGKLGHSKGFLKEVKVKKEYY